MRESADRGQQTRDQAGQQRCTDCDQQHARVERASFSRGMFPGSRLRQQTQKEIREHNADPAAADANQQRFGQQLPHHPAAARAQRGAHAQFAGPFGGARQQQVGRISAGNQQHERDGAKQQSISGRTGPMEMPVKLSTSAPQSPHTRSGYRLSNRAMIVPHLRLRLLDGYAGPQPRDEHVVVDVTICLLFGRQSKRNPDLRGLICEFP